jgi:hypothetical protein
MISRTPHGVSEGPLKVVEVAPMQHDHEMIIDGPRDRVAWVVILVPLIFATAKFMIQPWSEHVGLFAVAVVIELAVCIYAFFIRENLRLAGWAFFIAVALVLFFIIIPNLEKA